MITNKFIVLVKLDFNDLSNSKATLRKLVLTDDPDKPRCQGIYFLDNDGNWVEREETIPSPPENCLMQIALHKTTVDYLKGIKTNITIGDHLDGIILYGPNGKADITIKDLIENSHIWTTFE